MIKYYLIVLCFFLYLVTFNQSCRIESSITLVEKGKSDYCIILSNTASSSEKYAAQELQKTIEKISDCHLSIVSTQDAPESKCIFVGRSALADSLLNYSENLKFGDEEFLIRTIGQDLLIVGGKRRGTMYGVFTFLEDYLDCRWYTANIIQIPTKPTVRIGSINNEQKPGFEYRMPFFSEAFDRIWATHNKINGYGADLPQEVGGKMRYAKGALGHTFYSFVPPAKYYKEHPEYFSLVNGKRVKDRGQLCLTNPDVFQIVVQGIERWLQEDPGANIVSITQNDWEDWCECEDCKEVDEKEESHSATVVAFVNAVADSLGKKYPDIYFDTFAYTYTQKPPKTLTVRDNVIIRICHMNPCCDSHPLIGCDRNADYVKHLKTWRSRGGKMYVWHYVTNFNHYLMPLPNFNAIRNDIPFYYNEGVFGVFCQGDASPGGGGEWAELRSYVLAKLLWNPSVDVDDIIDDFMQGVYGKAADPIRQYFNMLHNIVQEPDQHFDLYSHPDEVGYLTPGILEKAHTLFKKAEGIVSDKPEILARVQKAHLPVYYADLWFQGQSQILTQKPVDQLMLQKFKEIVTDNKILYPASVANMTSFYRFLSADCRFVRNLKIIGPFDAPKESLLATVLPPEYEIDFAKEYKGVAGVKVFWQDWTEEKGPHVDFTTIFDPDTIGIAYGLCYINSPKELSTKLGVGSNDGVRVYLNDKLVHENAALRKAAPNSDIFDITLEKGWNKVLVKIDQIGAGWGMYLSVFDADRILKFSADKP